MRQNDEVWQGGQSVRDLSWVRKQGEIVEREKRKYLRPLPVKEGIAQLVDLFETFRDRLEDAERRHPGEKYQYWVEIQRRIGKLNDLKRST